MDKLAYIRGEGLSTNLSKKNFPNFIENNLDSEVVEVGRYFRLFRKTPIFQISYKFLTLKRFIFKNKNTSRKDRVLFYIKSNQYL